MTKANRNLFVLGVGAAALFLVYRNANASPALVDEAGRVTESIPGVTVEAEGGMPIIQSGESSASAADRMEAWGMQTGQAYMTMIDGYGMDGFGHAMNAGAMDAWYARPVGHYTPGGLFYPGMP